MPAFKRFAELYKRLTTRNDAEKIFDALMAAYTSPFRAYHNVRHIADCLEQFDAARSLFTHPNKAEFALWFHDAVYDSRVKDNEERSAQWAADVLNAGSASQETVASVTEFILATRHKELPSSQDACLVVDIDLSILGRDPATFDAYDAAIRKEYEWVLENDYRAGRAKVLREFVARKRLYITNFFADRFEIAARRNLLRAIEKLESA